jgi:HlyD family secretion protein
LNLKFKMRRPLLYLLLAVLLATLLFAWLRPSPVLVDVGAVTRGYLAVTLEEEGRTRVMVRYQISAPMAAHLRRITLDPGDPVKTNQELVVLEALPASFLDLRSRAEAEARVAAAEAALETSRREAEAAAANAAFARDEFQRLRQLAERQLVSVSDLERAEAEARRTEALQHSAEFRARTARFELEGARAALIQPGDRTPAAFLTMTSPVNGVVLQRHLESAQVVQPGQPLLEIGEPMALEVVADILSADAVRIESGMRVLLERWGRSEPLIGRVRLVEPAGFTRISALGVEEQRVPVIVDILSPPIQWQRLGDAYRVNARFILWEAEDVLRVPTSALFRQRDQWAVFVVDDNRARMRMVNIGPRGDLFTQALSGLAAGEQVIVHPDRAVEDGTRIRRRAESISNQ